jgi:MoxR-like ATPase
LARAAAVASKRLFLSVVINARTEVQDLQWQFDAVARLGEAQALAQYHKDEIPGRMHPRRFLTPGPLWWVFHWASAEAQFEECAHPLEPVPMPPEDWTPSRGSVLLIDEIDKADTDLPNGLLETLGNGDFAVPYLGLSVRQSQESPLPLVIITTNEERELPAAFLRRCVVLPLSLPEDDGELIDFLCKRGEVHFPGHCTEKVRRKAGELLLKDRKAAIDQGLPRPGQAEYLDLLRAVCKLADDERSQMDWLHKIDEFVLKKAPLLPR